MTEETKYYNEEHKRNCEMFKRCEFRGEDGSWSKDNHWKRPVRVDVDPEEADDMSRAITSMVGGVPVRKELPNGKIRLTSKGYYSNIGA